MNSPQTSPEDRILGRVRKALEMQKSGALTPQAMEEISAEIGVLSKQIRSKGNDLFIGGLLAAQDPATDMVDEESYLPPEVKQKLTKDEIRLYTYLLGQGGTTSVSQVARGLFGSECTPELRKKINFLFERLRRVLENARVRPLVGYTIVYPNFRKGSKRIEAGFMIRY